MNTANIASLLEKKKPLQGNIYGFFPNIDTYQGGRGKLDLWSALIPEFYFIKKETIFAKFFWEESQYTINLKKINETNFQGRIIADGEHVGSVYYTLFENKKGYILRGTWNEDEYNFDSIIDIRK